jgi:hypothetical protein
MNYTERLLEQADEELASQGRINIDTHAALLEAGCDTSAIERRFNDSNEQE